MDLMKKTVVGHTCTLQWRCDLTVTIFKVPSGLLSSSGLHHVAVDSVERLQCVMWSRLLVPAEGHIKGSSARRSL